MEKLMLFFTEIFCRLKHWIHRCRFYNQIFIQWLNLQLISNWDWIQILFILFNLRQHFLIWKMFFHNCWFWWIIFMIFLNIVSLRKWRVSLRPFFFLFSFNIFNFHLLFQNFMFLFCTFLVPLETHVFFIQFNEFWNQIL